MPEKSQNAVLKLYSIIFLCAVSKLKPKHKNDINQISNFSKLKFSLNCQEHSFLHNL